MHIAFDGGCFQQGILGGIYQVAVGFLNAAGEDNPDLKVTLICDSRQGLVREAALDGLTCAPRVIYAPIAKSYDEPEPWPSAIDPNVRFYCDGVVVPAAFADDEIARYVGPSPKRAFAVLSRTGRPVDSGLGSDRRRLGIKVKHVAIGGKSCTVNIAGYDRRLSAGFLDGGGAGRWTDGAGFIPIDFFPDHEGHLTIDIMFEAQERYAMEPGAAAEAVLDARRTRREAVRHQALRQLGDRLRAEGCVAYIANHFTPVAIPGLINAAWVFDLLPILMPRYFHLDARANMRENVRIFSNADRLYAISDCTRNDLIAQVPVDAGRVVVASIAPSPAFAPSDPALIRSVTSRLGLRAGGYIITVATIEPRKNHVRLMQAYVELRSRVPMAPDLLFVGSMGWDIKPALDFRTDNKLEHCVKIISGIPEDDLAALYSGAAFSAYVSVYEGFGLPIVEAMACGCAVLTSDRSSMPEIAGEAAIFVDPYDVGSIARGMEELITNTNLRAKLAKRGKMQAVSYSWKKSSRVVMDDLAQAIAAA